MILRAARAKGLQKRRRKAVRRKAVRRKAVRWKAVRRKGGGRVASSVGEGTPRSSEGCQEEGTVMN